MADSWHVQGDAVNNETTVFIVDSDKQAANSADLFIHSFGYQTKVFFSAHDFIEAYSEEQNGCLILDVRMPNMTGLELQEWMLSRKFLLPIIFITECNDISIAVHAMKKGAVDFLIKPVNSQALLEAINRAIQKDLTQRFAIDKVNKIQGCIQALTQREREVLNLMISGKPSKVIAHHLGISSHTIDLHRSRIMQKMKVRSLAELARLMEWCSQFKSDTINEGFWLNRTL